MILFHDVDGCLNADSVPLGFSHAALSAEHRRHLAELGALLDASRVEHFVLNTGRSWPTTQYLCAAIASTKARYALVEHGAALWDFQSGRTVDLHQVARHAGMQHVTTALNSIERVQELLHWYATTGSKQLARAMGLATPIAHELDQVANLTFAIPAGIDGDIAMHTLRNIIAAQPEFKNDSFVYNHSSSDGFIDVMGAMDKGLGVEVAVAYLRGDFQHTAAVGNGLNDLPMLSRVAEPLCPANAEPAVQNLCATHGQHSPHYFINATKRWLATQV